MTRIAHVSLFYADDKAINDLLLSSNRFTKTRLLDIARMRGLHLSADLTQRELARQLSVLDFSWPQLEALLAYVVSAERAERFTDRQLKTTASVDQILAALKKVKEKRASSEEIYSSSASGNSVAVKVVYAETDESLTMLRQYSQRDLNLLVEIDPAGTVRVRHQASDMGNRIMAAFREALADEVKVKELEQAEVSLRAVANLEQRTRFFTELFRLTSLTLKDVRRVSTSTRMITDGAEEDSEEDWELEDPDATGVVRSLAMSGSNVIASTEYQALIKTRFVHRAVWRSSFDGGDGALVEFEAGFRRPGTCTGFEVGVRRVWELNRSGGGHKKAPLPPKDIEPRRAALLRIVENRAVEVAAAIVAAVVVPTPPPPPTPSTAGTASTKSATPTPPSSRAKSTLPPTPRGG